MKLFGSKPPWYVAGLAFECTGCGRCCAGPEEGYVWATDEEIQRIARFLGLSESATRSRYVRKVGRRRSLKENKANNDCIFLSDPQDGGRKCAIYPVRPVQCRTWPFWPANLRSSEAWGYAALRCPGINRGDIHPLEEIEHKRDATGG